MTYTIDTLIEFDGTNQPISEHALDFGIPASRIVMRLNAGWPMEHAITRPVAVERDRIPRKRHLNDAERARLVDQQEFEAERKALRQKAFALVEEERQRQRDELDKWIGRLIPAGDVHRKQRITPAKLHYHDGVGKTMSEWAVIANVSLATLKARLRSGMSFEEAINLKPKPRGKLHAVNGISKTLPEWAKHLGISYDALIQRLHKGRTLAEAVAMKGRGAVKTQVEGKPDRLGSTARDRTNYKNAGESE